MVEALGLTRLIKPLRENSRADKQVDAAKYFNTLDEKQKEGLKLYYHLDLTLFSYDADDYFRTSKEQR